MYTNEIEELLDVLACAHLCGYDIREVLVLSNPKWKRWAGRLILGNPLNGYSHRTEKIMEGAER